MEEYAFLFIIAGVWIIFAVVQDMRTREVSNWLNFSLIAIVLAYRGFYALFTGELMFFVYGFLGVLLFVVLAYGFYYGKVFAGGDAKLLMGLGGVLPYGSFMDYLWLGGSFIFLIFGAGVVWTLVYSLYLVNKGKDKFVREFRREFRKGRGSIYLSVVVGIMIALFAFFIEQSVVYLGALLVFVIPWLYIYVRALEKGCMIVLKNPKELTEGEWLEKDVKLGVGKNKSIKKTVHGLSLKEIEILKKAKKRVWIKEGVPFTPAFLVAFGIFVWLWVKFGSGFLGYFTL